jgi:hypothetical protein
MPWDHERAAEQEQATRRRIARIASAIRDAQARGEVATRCEVDTVACFLLAAVEGAALMTRVSRDATIMQRCVSELDRYLTLYEASEVRVTA